MTPTELNVLRAQLIAMLCSGTKWPEMTEPQRSDLTMTAYGMSYGITNVCELFEPAIRTADAPAPSASEPCIWTNDHIDGGLDASCGGKWSLTDGTPADNNMRFCPFCGRRLEVKEAKP